MADRIPTYIDQNTQRISEAGQFDFIDAYGVKSSVIQTTNLSVDGVTYQPYDDSYVKADIAKKLDADKIWTGTEAEYNNLSPDADTLYFITA